MATPGSYESGHTTVQTVLNMVEFGADFQAAMNPPRFRLYEDTRRQIKSRVPTAVLTELNRRGHLLELLGDFNYAVGGGQSVMIDPESGRYRLRGVPAATGTRLRIEQPTTVPSQDHNVENRMNCPATDPSAS